MINEATYKGNIGAMEMIKLYQKATKKEIIELEKIIRRSDWDEYKKFVEKILGVKLK